MAAKFSIDFIHFTLQGLTTGLLAPSQPVTVNWYKSVSPPASVDSAFADFALLAAPPDTGYASINVGSWTDNGRVGDGWQYVSDDLVWTNSGLTDWESAEGLVFSTAGAFVGYIEFPAPIVLGPGSTETITINPDDINRY